MTSPDNDTLLAHVLDPDLPKGASDSPEKDEAADHGARLDAHDEMLADHHARLQALEGGMQGDQEEAPDGKLKERRDRAERTRTRKRH